MTSNHEIQYRCFFVVEALAFERKAQAQVVQRGEGRPTKKDRREIERFKSGAW